MPTSAPHLRPSTSASAGSPRRPRRAVAAAAFGLVFAGGLIAYGLSHTTDAGTPGPNAPPANAVLQPASVHSTQPVGGGTVPTLSDVNQVPANTADIAFPPVVPSIAP